MKVTILEIAGVLILALLIFLGVHFSLESRLVDGSSMEPTLHNGQRVLISKAAYWFGEPQRGDIIVFRKPGDPDSTLIKRIIGMPGEYIEIKDGMVYITSNPLRDAEPLDEPYIKEPPYMDFPGAEVPYDHYFVMGDNRNASDDSRKWGPVPLDNVIGKAWLCYWPLSDWHLVSGHSYGQY